MGYKIELLIIILTFNSSAFCRRSSSLTDLKCHDCFGLDEDLGGEFNCLFSNVKYGRCPKESKKKSMCLTIIPKDREDVKYFRRGCYLVDYHRSPGCWHHRAGTKSYISGVSDVDSRICICETDLCNNVDYSKRLLSEEERGDARKERKDFPLDKELDELDDDDEKRGKRSNSDHLKVSKIVILGSVLTLIICRLSLNFYG